MKGAPNPLYMSRLLRRVFALGAMNLCLVAGASAQAMRDPTRPPSQFLDPGEAAATAPPESPLQSIKRTGKHRTALLQGEWVKHGDRYGEAVVEKIDDQSLTLRFPDARRETFRMYPEVDLQPVKAAKRMAGK